jgi:threonine aldolase
MSGIRLNPEDIETNIVIFGFSHPRISIPGLLAELEKRQVLALSVKGGLRLVTHKDIDDQDVERAIAAFKEILK